MHRPEPGQLAARHCWTLFLLLVVGCDDKTFHAVDAAADAAVDVGPPAPPCLPVLAPGAVLAAEGPVYLLSRASGLVVTAAATNQPASEGRHVGSPQQRFILDRAGAAVTLRGPLGLCLARSEESVGTIGLGACDAPAAAWQLMPGEADAHRLKDPAAARYLAVQSDAISDGRALVLATSPEPRTSFLLVDAAYRAAGISACDDPPLDQLTFLATHNSFHTSGEGGKLLPNHSRSIARQLEDGVRGLLLDVHDWENTVWTCHGSCLVPGLRGRPLSEPLATIAAFLARDRNAIVTLFLEDRVADANRLCGIIAATPGLAPLIFDPAQHDVLERGWPRRSELLASNQRLLIFSQRAGREACGIQHDRRYTAENFWSLGPAGVNDPNISCVSRWAGQPLASCTGKRFRPLFLMNHFRDSLYAPFCAGDNGPLLRQRALEICPQAAVAKPNFIAVDCYEEGEAAAVVAELNRCDPTGCRCAP